MFSKPISPIKHYVLSIDFYAMLEVALSLVVIITLPTSLSLSSKLGGRNHTAIKTKDTLCLLKRVIRIYEFNC